MARPRVNEKLPPKLQHGRVHCRLAPSGIYHARWTQNGERQSCSTKARTVAGAIKWMEKVDLQIESEVTVEITDLTVTVQDAYNKFTTKNKRWTDSTTESLTPQFTARFLPAFGVRLLASVTQQQLESWLAEQDMKLDRNNPGKFTDQELSASSRNKLKGCVSTFFKWCCREGGLLPRASNPAVELIHHKEPRNLDLVESALTEQQCDDVLAYLKALSTPRTGRDGDVYSRSPYAYYIAMLAVDTGMRRGELRAITWEDVNFERGLIRTDGNKTKLVRYVPMTTRVREALLHRREAALGGPVVPSDNIRRALNSAARHAGLEKFKFHGLRHTAATRLIEQGVEIEIVQKALGHTSMEMTRRYVNVRQAKLEEGFGKLDDMIQSKKPKLTVQG